MDRLQLQELIAGLGSAVEDFGRAGAVARGGKQDSGQFYQGLAQSAGRARDRELEDRSKKEAAVRQSVLDNYKAKEEARASSVFDANQARIAADDAVLAEEKDPNSEKSRVAQELAGKLMPTRSFEGMSAFELKTSLPTMEKMFAIDEGNKLKRETAERASEDRRLDRQDKADARNDARVTAEANKQVSPTGKPLTAGQKKVDENYASQYNDFSGKGASNAKVTIEQLEAFRKQLEAESKKNIQSGGGRSTVFIPDFARTDQSLIWKRDIPAKANLVLKDLFGGQLSNDERKSESATYYDDMLSPAENAKKLGEKIRQLRAGYENESRKARYYEKHGTLNGFTAQADGESEQGGEMREQGEKVIGGKRFRKVQGGWQEVE